MLLLPAARYTIRLSLSCSFVADDCFALERLGDWVFAFLHVQRCTVAWRLHRFPLRWRVVHVFQELTQNITTGSFYILFLHPDPTACCCHPPASHRFLSVWNAVSLGYRYSSGEIAYWLWNCNCTTLIDSSLIWGYIQIFGLNIF